MSRKIAIIDDDRVTLTLLEKVLKQEGFQVVTAMDGAEGLDLVIAEEPDIVITDLLLPKIHGLELCKKIKSHANLERVIIIVMTAVYKGLSFKGDIEESGADYYLEKPLDIPSLLGIIERSSLP